MADLPVVATDRLEMYTPEWIDAISVAAEAALSSIVDVAAHSEIELPSKQLIYVGTVPQDCELVAVSASTYGFGRPGDPGPAIDSTGCWYPTSVSLNAQITRCVPETNQVRPMGRYATGLVELPDSISMEDHARTVMRDMRLLLEAANVASNYPYPGAGAEANVMVTDPQDAYQTVIMSLTLQV